MTDSTLPPVEEDDQFDGADPALWGVIAVAITAFSLLVGCLIEVMTRGIL